MKDPEKMLFFDKNELGDATGKVIFSSSLYISSLTWTAVHCGEPKIEFKFNSNEQCALKIQV